jgi:hypothetical protein
MAQEFREIVAALWRSLRLSRPRFHPENGAAALTVDGVAITLRLAKDGRHIAVAARAGRLSASPAAAEAQVAHLLKANLATLLSSRAGLCLEDQEAQSPSALVRAVVPFDPRGADHATTKLMERLVKAISDVAHLARAHGRVLGSDAPAQPTTLVEELSSDMLVFRL